MNNQQLIYRTNDTPSPLFAILFGFQQLMVCVSALLVIPFLISEVICAGDAISIIRVRLISTTFVVSGISTIIQSTIGARLALLQGTSFAYVPPILAFVKLDENKCNASVNDFVSEEIWSKKLLQIQGSLIAASFVPILIGLTGLIGLITKYIGPITVVPLMLLLVLSSVNICVTNIEKHWVSLVQVATLFATILYLAEVRIPLPIFDRNRSKWIRSNIIGQFPYLIAILLAWGFCLLLTLTDIEPVDGEARVDKNRTMIVLHNAPWFSVPYPGQWGTIDIHVGLMLAFIASSLTSVFESVGDYHAAARVSNEPPPPSHAINRGIIAEGIGSMIAGFLGCGVGMTTHTENIGVIGVTKVASRFTMQLAGVFLIALGVLTKFGAILSTIPDALVGGVLASSMAMVGGVALSTVQQIDLKLSRNLAILGMSLMTGMIVPLYFERHQLNTGFEFVDRLLNVLLTLRMFVGAFVACLLDNTVSGATREQRGLRARGMMINDGDYCNDIDIYAFSPFFTRLINKVPYISMLPFIPNDKKKQRNTVTFPVHQQQSKSSPITTDI